MSHLEFLSMSKNPSLSRARKKRKRLKKERKKEVQLTDKKTTAINIKKNIDTYEYRQKNCHL